MPHAPPPTEQIVSNAADYFEKLIADIDSARHAISLEVYIFEEDAIGRRVAEALARAARRGVDVRVLIDGFGSPMWGRMLGRSFLNAGVRVRIYHPLPFQFKHWGFSPVHANFFSKFLFFLVRMNRRNHRKTVVIDHTIAWVGSFNVSHAHMPKSAGGSNWRDCAVRLAGGDFFALEAAFSRAWRGYRRFRRRFGLHKKKNLLFRLNHTRRLRRRLYKDLLWRLRQCDRRVWITNAYFVPEYRLLRRICRAARVGKDVRILLPHRSDVRFVPWATSVFYEIMLKSGVRIYEYMKGNLHAKTIIIDDWVCVGSTNLNYRSLRHDLEVDAILSSAGAKAIVERDFMADIEHAHEIRWSEAEFRGFFERLLGRVVLLLRYWI